MASTDEAVDRSGTACPDDGRLRTYLDVADPHVAAHVRKCDDCDRRSAVLRADARLAAQAIADLGDPAAVPADAESALQTIRAQVPSLVERRARRMRLPVSIAAGFVVLLVAALVALTPTGRQAAADFLASFRAERLQVVTFDPNQPLQGLDQLAEIVSVDAEPAEPQVVDDAEHAAAVAGFTPSAVSDLPDGAQLSDTLASPPTTVRLTFDEDRTPDLPSALDGATLVVSIPGSVIANYAVGPEMLFVAEAGQLTVEAEGADLAEVREYLLSRPEMPQDVARQLLAIDDWTATLPVPVPVDEIAWRETTVAGQPGLMLSDPMGAGLLWHQNGRIHAVGGTATDADELREIADGIAG